MLRGCALRAGMTQRLWVEVPGMAWDLRVSRSIGSNYAIDTALRLQTTASGASRLPGW